MKEYASFSHFICDLIVKYVNPDFKHIDPKIITYNAVISSNDELNKIYKITYYTSHNIDVKKVFETVISKYFDANDIKEEFSNQIVQIEGIIYTVYLDDQDNRVYSPQVIQNIFVAGQTSISSLARRMRFKVL